MTRNSVSHPEVTPHEMDVMQHEANQFAMELLMPAEWIMRDAAGVDIADDEAVARLAKKYRVPVTAMAIRIGMVCMGAIPVKPRVRVRARST